MFASTVQATAFQDISNALSITKSRPIFDRQSRVYLVYVTATNTAEEELAGPLRLVVSNASHATLNHHSQTGDASYFSMASLQLAPSESEIIAVRFALQRKTLAFDVSVEQHTDAVIIPSPEKMRAGLGETETAELTGFENPKTQIITGSVTDSDTGLMMTAFSGKHQGDGFAYRLDATLVNDIMRAFFSLMVDEGTVNMEFEITNPLLFDLTAQELADQIFAGLIVEPDGTGYKVTVPKALMSTLSGTEHYVISGVEDVEIEVIEDDPVFYIWDYAIPPGNIVSESCHEHPEDDVKVCDSAEYSYMEISAPESRQAWNKWHDWVAFADQHAPLIMESGPTYFGLGHLDVNSFVMANRRDDMSSTVRRLSYPGGNSFMNLYFPLENLPENIAITNLKGMYGNTPYRLFHVFQDRSFSDGLRTVHARLCAGSCVNDVFFKRTAKFERKRGHIYILVWKSLITTVPEKTYGRFHGWTHYWTANLPRFERKANWITTLSPIPSSLSGNWSGTYTSKCGPDREIPITMSLSQSGSTVTGTMSYSGETITLNWGVRGHQPQFGTHGMRNVLPLSNGSFFKLTHEGNSEVPNNEFDGQLTHANLIEGTTLNGEAYGGCSGTASPGGKFSLTRN